MFDWRQDLENAVSDLQMVYHVIHFLVGLGVAYFLSQAHVPPIGVLVSIVAVAAGKEWLDALWAGAHGRRINVIDSVADFAGWLLAWVVVQAKP